MRSVTQGKDDDLGSGCHIHDVGQERGMHGPLQGAVELGPPCQGGVRIWAG